MTIADLSISRSERIRTIIPVVFFLSPLVASLVPRLTWLFLLVIATAVIMPVLRRRREWRQLIQPNAMLVAPLAVAFYVLLNATWAVDRGAAFGKGALLLGVVLFAASIVAADWDEMQLRPVALSFAVGVFLGALLVLFELLTDGALTRLALNSIALLYPDNPKHMHVSGGQVTKIRLSELNQNIAILMFNLWPGTAVFENNRGRHSPCDSRWSVVFSDVCSHPHLRASIIANSSDRVSPYLFTRTDVAEPSHTRTRDSLVSSLRTRIASQLFRLQGGLAYGVVVTNIFQGSRDHLGLHRRTCT